MEQLFLIVLTLISISLSWTVAVRAQTAVPVTIIIRQADGSPAAGETVQLIRHPEMTVLTAVTDELGHCTFTLPRGLYEVRFEATLDSVSALAVAENGLDGFGITVGDTPVTYHFTLQPDSHVYFDGAPAAAVPSPIVPDSADSPFIGGAGEATPTPMSAAPVPAITATTASPTSPTAVPEPETSVSESLGILLISLIGVAMGVTGAIVSRKWR